MKVTRIFGRYVAPQVVDEILEIGEENLKLGGTKRRISLLFIDIRDNTGDVVVGKIGAENRMEYSAIGDAVNLAARLESNAKPGQVLVSPEVFKEVDGRLPLNPVGEITVKGKAKPIMVYELEYEDKLS